VSLSLLKNVFLPTTAKPIKPIPSKSMVAGSGISENEKGIAILKRCSPQFLKIFAL
jgi:hypothetical protein